MTVLPQKTILLADDDPHMRDLVMATLADPGYRILLAASGREAMRACDTAAPDLLIVDWMMPGVSGLEVVREVRRRRSSQRILMLTAKAQAADAVIARDAGANEYLVKPFSPLDLIARVTTILG